MTQQPRAKAGRPRSVGARAAILDASIALTREVGFDALAMEAIAKRAGVGKSTVYRWWPSKEVLIAEALGRFARAIPVPDTGSLEDDLTTILLGTMRMYGDPATKVLLPALLAAMARSPLVARTVRSGLVSARRTAMREVLARAVTSGELPRTTDLELSLDLLSGPLLHRAVVMGRKINTHMVTAVVQAVLQGLGARKVKR